MENSCKCKHHKVIPFLMVVFGVSFFMGFLGITSWDAVNLIWPVLVIIAGIIKFGDMSGMCHCCDGGCSC